MGVKTTGKFYYDGAAVNVAVGTPLVFATSKTCGSVNLAPDDSTVRITHPGLYRVTANVNFIATAAGTASVALYANGSTVAGANGGETLAAVGDSGNVSFSTLLTVLPTVPGTIAELQLVNTGLATSITVANLIVEKVA